MLTHASLFSGIGGFDMAAALKGWYNIFSCENDPFCRKILKFYWPQTEHYGDIHQFDATPYRGTINVLSGGFPCQPFSSAGRRQGKEDDRYLWPQTRRIITEVRPDWIVLENVAGLFSILEPESLSEMEIKTIELFCSDSEQEANATIIRLQRRVIGSIITEIKSAGYLLPQLEDGTPIVLCIPACAIGAPHRRDRLWFVAHTDQDGAWAAQPPSDEAIPSGPKQDGTFRRRSDRTALSDRPGRNSFDGVFSQLAGKWENWPTQPPFCGDDDGLPHTLDGIAFSKWRDASIKAYGNAIVPDVALELFSAIEAVHLSL